MSRRRAAFVPAATHVIRGAAVILVTLTACTTRDARPVDRASDSAGGATTTPATTRTDSVRVDGADALLGDWVQPVPGQPGAEQGFRLAPGGHAQSIDMATLRHDLWRRAGDTIVIVTASIGNRVTSVDAHRLVPRREGDGTTALVDADGQLYRRRIAGLAMPAPRCFAASDSTGRISATLFVRDSSVTGRLTYALARKDGNDGALEATIGADSTITGTYHYYSEGLLSARDAAFRLEQGTLVESDSPLVLERGRFTYRGGRATRFGGVRLAPVACSATP
ncbi:MAG: lipocalin family protein [Gemmatimonadaceae bacterium]|nr:lipocalin family protein [Gemmatimonadaceae bacterium]